MAMAAKNACRKSKLSIFTRAALGIDDLKFGEMEFSEMKRNAVSMPLSDPWAWV